MRKKLLGISLLTLSILVAGCGNTATTTKPGDTTPTNSNTINIVATSFHEYDWVKQVIGEEQEQFHITLLINNGTDLHNYEPTVADMATITSSDLFIYNGGESEAWADDIIDANPELNHIKIMNVLEESLRHEVIVDGMEHSHQHEDEHEDVDEHKHEHEDMDEHDHEHVDEHEYEHEDEHDHEHEDMGEHDHEHVDAAYDEHVWLSLNNAMVVCEEFSQELGELDPDNGDVYNANMEGYVEQLETLDNAYKTMVTDAPRDTIIVTDRFPFLYLASDYGIDYFAAFTGCSAETEASFQTVTFLAEKVDEYDINNVIILENGLDKLASTVIQSSRNQDATILTLNSMQSITQDDINAGITYSSIMEANLEVLSQALAD